MTPEGGGREGGREGEEGCSEKGKGKMEREEKKIKERGGGRKSGKKGEKER